MFNNVMTGNYNTDPIPVYFKCPECGTAGPHSDLVSIVANGDKRFCPNCHTTIVKDLDTMIAPCDCCADIRRAEAELGSLQTKRPIWIEVEGGDLFEGHQGHWVDCFFSNATESLIREHCFDVGWKYTIREMTDGEIAQYPEAVETQKWLLETYGEC